MRDNAGIRELARLATRARVVPAARLHLRRRSPGVPRPRRRAPGAAPPRRRTRCPAWHPLGTCRRPAPGDRVRLTHHVTRPHISAIAWTLTPKQDARMGFAHEVRSWLR